MAQTCAPEYHGHQPQKHPQPLPTELQKQYVVGRVLTLIPKTLKKSFQKVSFSARSLLSPSHSLENCNARCFISFQLNAIPVARNDSVFYSLKAILFFARSMA
jgi:hypothetical protein